MSFKYDYEEDDEQVSFYDNYGNDDNDEYTNAEYLDNDHDDGAAYCNEDNGNDAVGYNDDEDEASGGHSPLTASHSSISRSSSRYRDEYLRRITTATDDDEAVLRRERDVKALRQLNHMVLMSNSHSLGNSSSSRSSRSRMRSGDDKSSMSQRLRVSPASGRWRAVVPTTSNEYEEDDGHYYHDDEEEGEEEYNDEDDGTYLDNSNSRYAAADGGQDDYSHSSRHQDDQQWSEQQRRSTNIYHGAGRKQQLQRQSSGNRSDTSFQSAPPTNHHPYVSGSVQQEDSGGTGSSCSLCPPPSSKSHQSYYRHRLTSSNNNNKGRGTNSLPSPPLGFTPQQELRSPESDHPPPLPMEVDVISTMSASAITIGSRKKLTQQQQLLLLARGVDKVRAIIPSKVVFPNKTARDNRGGTRRISQEQQQQYRRRAANELEMSDATIVQPPNNPLKSFDTRTRPNKMVGRGKSFSSANTRRSSIDRSTTTNNIIVRSRRSSLESMISDVIYSGRRRTRSSSRGGSGSGSGRKDSQQRSIVSARRRSQSLEQRDGRGRRPSAGGNRDYRRPSSSTVRSMSKGQRPTPAYSSNDLIISPPKQTQEEHNNDWRITTSKSLMMQQYHNIDDEGYCHYHPDIRLMKLRQDGRWRVLRKKCPECSSASSCSSSRGGNLRRSSSRSIHHSRRKIVYDHYDNDYDDDDYIEDFIMEDKKWNATSSSSSTDSMSFLDDLGMSVQTPEEMEAEEAKNRLKRRLAARAYHFPGNTWWQDWLQYLSNTHTVLGLFFHHPLHPMRFKERVVMLLGSVAIGLTISNFTYMYFIKNGYSTNEVVVDLGFVVVTRLTITLWTLGSFIHTVFDLLLWHTKACTICRYKGRIDESLPRWGRVFGLFVVGCAMFAGTYAVLLRASIEYEDEGSISEEVMESIKSNEIYRIEFEDKRSFKFLMGYLIEFVMAMFIYYPIAVTILFSGVLGCGGRIPILGGRLREMKRESRYEMNKRQPKILKALNIEGDGSDLSNSRTFSRSDIV